MANKVISYDANVIQEFAGRLYKQAASAVFMSTLLGFFGGLLAGGGAVSMLNGKDGAVIALIISVLVGTAFGYSRGRERAFKLKLEAQVALCQVQIERNTSSNLAQK